MKVASSLKLKHYLQFLLKETGKDWQDFKQEKDEIDVDNDNAG